MSSQRLRVQFETLFEHFHGADVNVQIEEITDIFSCTRRNARMVLNKLEEQGWIEWHPSAGRGKSSQLVFKQSRDEISHHLARRYLEDGNYASALTVLKSDSSELDQVLLDYFGVHIDDELPIARFPYFKPVATLDPIKARSRMEQQLIGQVFNGLVKYDVNLGVKADLAYKWEAISNTHWRFYLRTGVYFHNGQRLDSSHVALCILDLRRFSFYSHIDDVTVVSDNIVDILLTSPDIHLDRALAETCAKIRLLRHETIDESKVTTSQLIGTGPFKLEKYDDDKLDLVIHDTYFGQRPLIEKLEIQILTNAPFALTYPSFDCPRRKREHKNEEAYLDFGCSYLMVNQRSGVAQDNDWARYLATKLNSSAIFREISESLMVNYHLLPAYGMKSGWYHTNQTSDVVPPKSNNTITLAYCERHPYFHYYVDAIIAILATDNVDVEVVSIRDHIEGGHDVDVVLDSIDLIDNNIDSLVSWLFNSSHLEQFCTPEQFTYPYSLFEQWRIGDVMDFPVKSLSKWFIQHHHIIPLSHQWLGCEENSYQHHIPLNDALAV
ncbi:SgrR family transcriptional regulator [Vibrio sp. WJH972]